MKRVIFIIALLSMLTAGNIFYTKDIKAQEAGGNDDSSCWGSDQKCSDGKFRDYQGKEQPDHCDNLPDGPNKDKSSTMHDCDCERSSEMCDTGNDPSVYPSRSHPGASCKTNCRPKACGCASKCDS
jgi:hypothetical protein